MEDRTDGDGYRLKNRKAGQYAALAEWAKRTDNAKHKGGRAAPALAPGRRSRGLGNVERQIASRWPVLDPRTPDGQVPRSRVAGDTHVVALGDAQERRSGSTGGWKACLKNP